MKSAPTRTQPATSAQRAAAKFTLIYDDFATGTQAKRFADMIAAATGVEGCVIAPWRCEMLGWDGLAAEASRDAESSDYVIFSLRGDGSLSSEVKRWIEAWLAGRGRGNAAIVALFDPARCSASHANGTRHYLRHVAQSAGVDFFGHCAVSAPAGGPVSRRRRGAGALAGLLVAELIAA